MFNNSDELSEQDKIDIILHLLKTKMLDLRLNCFHEVELYPKGMDYPTYWYLLGEWDISEEDMELMPKLMVQLHKKGICLAKHIETV